MLGWLKNIFYKNVNKDDSIRISEKIEGNTTLAPANEAIVLSDKIQAYLDENGKEETMRWLLENLVENLSGYQSADVFAGYYNNYYSKRDVLDRYDDIIVIDKGIIDAISILGSSYNSDFLEGAYSKISFSVIAKETLLNIAERVSKNTIDLKEINDMLYSEYFSFVKNSLVLADKIKASGVKVMVQENEPVDEIEATIRRLLEAEEKSNGTGHKKSP